MGIFKEFGKALDPFDIWGSGGVSADTLLGKKDQQAAGQAADATLQAAREAEALNRERYAEAQGRLDPYMRGSERAYGHLQQMMGLPYETSAPNQYIQHSGMRGGMMSPGGRIERGPELAQGQMMGMTDVPGAYQGDPYADFKDQYGADIMPDLPEMDYQDTAAYGQSQDAIRQVMEERQAQAAEAMGGAGGFYGGRRAREAADIGGEQQIALANLEQSSMQNYYDRMARGQGMRQQGAGMLAGMEGERQNWNQQNYVNYMNTLQNLASPGTAQSLSAMGMNQGQAIGQQNLLAQQSANQSRMAGQQARTDAQGNLINTGLQIAGMFI